LESKEFSREAIDELKKHHWPGNVRELKNLVERLVIMTPGKAVQAKDIPLPSTRSKQIKEEVESSLMLDSFKKAKSRFERVFIEKKLREFNGNISQTAEAIGIERSNLHKKIKAFGLEDFRSQ
jgi:two-component system nitrogen regulation response regulator NtrX